MSRHPAVVALLRWFSYDHLPKGPVRLVSQQCCELAHELAASLPDDPELSDGLRELLKAKDAFVRAAIRAQDGSPEAFGPRETR
jgi:hypothetical protein